MTMDICPISHPADRFGEVGVMNSCMEILGGSVPNTQKKMDAFAPIVSELAGQCINLLVFTNAP